MKSEAKTDRLNSFAEEAANRAEVTAILIRLGYGVYRPEFDWNGEDLVIKTSDNKDFRVAQLKARACVDKKYFGKNIWMLFPSGSFSKTTERTWYLIPHDTLFVYIEAHHGHAPCWKKKPEWSYRSIPEHLQIFLSDWKLNRKDKIEEID